MRNVIIVGGGLAGLTCAKVLQKHGVACELFEAADGIGGRVRTDIVDGFRLDRGFQVLLTAYPAAKSLLDYKALDLKMFQAGAVIRRKGSFHRFADPWRQPEYFFATAFSSLATIGDKLRVGRLRSELASRSLDQVIAAEEQTSLEFLKAYGFSDRIIEGFFRPFFGGVFLESQLTTTSRKLQFVFKMFSQGSAAVPALGMQQIPDQLANSLPPDSIHLNSPVKAVSANEVFLEDGRRLVADAVVLAAEASVTNRLLGKSDEVAWNRVRCAYFAASKSPYAAPVLLLNGDGKGPINNLCVMTEASAAYASDDRHLVSVSVLDQEIDDEQLLAAIRRQATEWFGEAAGSWTHLKTYDVRQALPTQPPGLAAPEIRHDSGVYCCGDRHGLASIQSAMQSGREVADVVAESLLAASV